MDQSCFGGLRKTCPMLGNWFKKDRCVIYQPHCSNHYVQLQTHFIDTSAKCASCEIKLNGRSEHRTKKQCGPWGLTSWTSAHDGVCKDCQTPKYLTNWLKSDFQCWLISHSPECCSDCSSSSSVEVWLKLPHTLANLTPQWTIAAQTDTHGHTPKVTCICKCLDTSIKTQTHT